MSLFLANNRNHRRPVLNSRTYDKIREDLSEAMKGVPPSLNCRLAVSRAKKGKPLSLEHRRLLTQSLTRTKSFFAVSPDNVMIESDDLRGWCSLHSVSYHTVVKRISEHPYVITAGKNKGWIFSLLPIADCDIIRNNCLLLAHQNRSLSLLKYGQRNIHTA